MFEYIFILCLFPGGFCQSEPPGRFYCFNLTKTCTSQTSSNAEKPPAVPISNELLKKDEGSPSTAEPGTLSKERNVLEGWAARCQ